jgi:hypothetical protein
MSRVWGLNSETIYISSPPWTFLHTRAAKKQKCEEKAKEQNPNAFKN